MLYIYIYIYVFIYYIWQILGLPLMMPKSLGPPKMGLMTSC